MAGNQVAIAADTLPSMESYNRFSKLPMVESTIETATNFYGKVKDYNNFTNWTFSTAESTVTLAAHMGMPIATPMINKFEGQIKKVDDALCTGLDYVETKVPAVKMPPGEIYSTTKDYYKQNLEPAVETARAIAEPALKTAKDLVQPAVEKAKTAVVEPAVEMAKQYVEPAMNTINAVKENVMQKVDEYLHRGHDKHEDDQDDCEECQRINNEMKNEAKENKQE